MPIFIWLSVLLLLNKANHFRDIGKKGKAGQNWSTGEDQLYLLRIMSRRVKLSVYKKIAKGAVFW